jgi:hypothetical protein
LLLALITRRLDRKSFVEFRQRPFDFFEQRPSGLAPQALAVLEVTPHDDGHAHRLQPSRLTVITRRVNIFGMIVSFIVDYH